MAAPARLWVPNPRDLPDYAAPEVGRPPYEGPVVAATHRRAWRTLDRAVHARYGRARGRGHLLLRPRHSGCGHREPSRSRDQVEVSQTGAGTDVPVSQQDHGVLDDRPGPHQCAPHARGTRDHVLRPHPAGELPRSPCCCSCSSGTDIWSQAHIIQRRAGPGVLHRLAWVGALSSWLACLESPTRWAAGPRAATEGGVRVRRGRPRREPRTQGTVRFGPGGSGARAPRPPDRAAPRRRRTRHQTPVGPTQGPFIVRATRNCPDCARMSTVQVIVRADGARRRVTSGDVG